MKNEINFCLPGRSFSNKLFLRRTLVRLEFHWAKQPGSQTTKRQTHEGTQKPSVQFCTSPSPWFKSTQRHTETPKTSVQPSSFMPSWFTTCIVVFFFSLCTTNINAQSLIDTTYRTTYYIQKITQFRLLPNKKNEIIFLGNSITDIGEWTEIWNNINVKNRGISGDNTFGVLARLDEVVASKPAKIFIMIGINDIARNTPDSIIVANYKKIVQGIRSASPKTKIFIQSVLPTNNSFTEYARHQNKGQHIVFVNKALRNLCLEQNLVYVDLHSRFLDALGKLDVQYTNDGLHLSGAGYLLWKKILTQKGYMK